MYEYLAHPPVNCFMDDKLNSLEEAEKEADQRRKKGEHFAVCFSDTDLIIGDLFAIKEEPDRLCDFFMPLCGVALKYFYGTKPKCHSTQSSEWQVFRRNNID